MSCGVFQGTPPPPALQYEPARGAPGRLCAVVTLRRTSPRSLTLRPKRAKVRESPNRTKDENIQSHCAIRTPGMRVLFVFVAIDIGLEGAGTRTFNRCQRPFSDSVVRIALASHRSVS